MPSWLGPNPKYPGYYPVLIPGWTLNYEMMFYLIFSCALFLPTRLRLMAILTVLCALTAAGRAASGGILAFYTNPVILEFGAGVLIGALYMSGARVPASASVAALIAGVVLLFCLAPLTGLHRAISAGIPAALIVGGSTLLEQAKGAVDKPLLRYVGDVSYSIQLSHVITLPPVTKLWAALHLGAQGWGAILFYLASAVAALAAGSLTYAVLEKPLTAMVRLLWPEHRRRSLAT